jgi:uncharacterized Zn finger protein
LRSYADYANRIGRGSSYVLNGMVLDLRIGAGHINAIVAGSGSKPYDVVVEIADISKRKWDEIVGICGKSVAGMDALVEGKFPKELAALFTQKEKGIFPSPKEIKFGCSCPDWAYMCKHVAAAMYAAGARLDEDPLLFFKLRNADFTELLKRSVEEKMESMLKNAGRKTERVIADGEVKALFGV